MTDPCTTSHDVSVENLPTVVNFKLKRGDTWVYEYEDGFVDHAGVFTPSDLTGVSIRFHVVSIDDVLLFARSTSAGTIVVDPLLGKVSFGISVAEWPSITWSDGLYDLEYTFADGTVETLLEGKIHVVKGRTN